MPEKNAKTVTGLEPQETCGTHFKANNCLIAPRSLIINYIISIGKHLEYFSDFINT